ncbi:TonB family protein [Parvularcula sp. LCG005]|uniref:TonB family protein n=1 Tax=Parvularcula sp. LCG005 TaxID=3078805 RepID=UPI0029423171|nr:TonB family protein [Parvularcula sp. LCG005]WOI52147.1 TonB family protein [Parvularcula sp. LCG005]
MIRAVGLVVAAGSVLMACSTPSISSAAFSSTGAGGVYPYPYEAVPLPLRRVAPAYPAACWDDVDERAEKVVVVGFRVLKSGRVGGATVLETSDDCFNRAAVKAIEQWQFPPLEEWPSGTPTEFAIRLNFRTTDEPSALAGRGTCLDATGKPLAGDENCAYRRIETDGDGR